MNQPDFGQLARLPELSEEEKRQRILAGLDDVDACRLIPHEEVISWARTLFKSGDGTNGIE